MPTRNVVLTGPQSEMVEALVASGRYQNASEVLREGLRLLAQREAENAGKIAVLRAAIGEGEADIDAGRFVEFGTADELRKHLASLAEEVLGSPKT